MPVAPAIACVVVRRWITGEGFGDAGLRPRLRRAWPLLLVAVCWPLVATPLAVLVAQTAGVAPDGSDLPWGLGDVDALTLVGWVAMAAAVMPIILGEELGWRGYLQLRLFPGRPLRAALTTGLLWAVWHYPLWLATAEPVSGMGYHLLFGTVALTYFSVFLGWLQIRTRSVWTPTAAHAANNATEANLNGEIGRAS